MDSLKKRITRTRIEGLFILLLAIGYVWEAHNFPSHPFVHSPGVPGPEVFPLILGTFFGLTGLWLIISPEKLKSKKKRRGAGADEQVVPPHSGVSLWKRIASEWHLGTMWIVLFGYMFLMPSLGFPVTTAVFLGVFFFLLGEKHWYMGIGLALLSTMMIYLFFAETLKVRLPLGILKPLLQ